MKASNIEKDIEKIRKLGLLGGKVIEIDCYIDKDIYLKFKSFLNKYSHIKEEDIMSCVLYEFIKKYR